MKRKATNSNFCDLISEGQESLFSFQVRRANCTVHKNGNGGISRPAASQQVLNTLRSNGALWATRRSAPASIGASAGVATYPGDGRSVHAIIGAADKRMYTVKSTGRGRVEA